jgi:hypothetical protein
LALFQSCYITRGEGIGKGKKKKKKVRGITEKKNLKYTFIYLSGTKWKLYWSEIEKTLADIHSTAITDLSKNLSAIRI